MSSETPIKLVYDEFEPTVKSNLPDIILLHGGASWRQTWHYIAKHLADKTGRKVYAPDMRNHGDSGWTDCVNFNTNVNDLAHFIEERHMDAAVIIGHSMGGKIAINFALQQPEKVSKLVVEDFSPKPLSETLFSVPWTTMQLLVRGLDLIPPDVDLPTAQKIVSDFRFQNVPENFATVPERRDHGATFPLVKKDGRYVWKTNMAALDKSLADPDWNKALDGVYKKPSLFIFGTRSPFNVSQDKDEILKLFPSAKLKAIEGASHLVHAEYPEEFCESVVDFLTES